MACIYNASGTITSVSYTIDASSIKFTSPGGSVTFPVLSVPDSLKRYYVTFDSNGSTVWNEMFPGNDNDIITNNPNTTNFTNVDFATYNNTGGNVLTLKYGSQTSDTLPSYLSGHTLLKMLNDDNNTFLNFKFAQNAQGKIVFGDESSPPLLSSYMNYNPSGNALTILSNDKNIELQCFLTSEDIYGLEFITNNSTSNCSFPLDNGTERDIMTYVNALSTVFRKKFYGVLELTSDKSIDTGGTLDTFIPWDTFVTNSADSYSPGISFFDGTKKWIKFGRPGTFLLSLRIQVNYNTTNNAFIQYADNNFNRFFGPIATTKYDILSSPYQNNQYMLQFVYNLTDSNSNQIGVTLKPTDANLQYSTDYVTILLGYTTWIIHEI